MMQFDPWFLALYAVIGGLSLGAVYYLIRYVVLPAVESGGKVNRYLFGLGAAAAMVAHFVENALYGLGRWFPEYRALLLDQHIAGAGKLLIIASTVITLAAIIRARTGNARWPMLVCVSVALYVIGFVGAAAVQAFR